MYSKKCSSVCSRECFTSLNSKKELAASPSSHLDTVSAKPILANRSIRPCGGGVDSVV